MLTSIDGPPPSDALRVLAWADTKAPTTRATYILDEGPTSRRITVSGHRRQTLEALRRGPVFAASLARLSDVVFVLRGLGIEITTDLHRDDDTGAAVGVYRLRSRVALAQCEVQP
ncbi:MAG: hypothetical protein ACU0DW_13730 [Shimia sp.]